MPIMQELDAGGYLKAGFLGFPKSGKTFTAALLAIGTRNYFKLPGRIAFFDTETGASYVSAMIMKATGNKPVGKRSRSLGDLLEVAHEAEDTGCSVMIVDSVTHVWRELCDSYLYQLNQKLQEAGKPRRTRLEFQDWGPLKAKWAEWTDWYLNSKMHVIIAGRAGYEYEDYYDENDRKQMIKTGTKMKTESEFGFEPSLLVEMERIGVSPQDNAASKQRGGRRGAAKPQPKASPVIRQRATCIGDRFDQLTGAQAENPTFEFFKPHLDCLVPMAHAPIDTASKTDLQLDDQGSDPWMRERRLRKILSEDIQGQFLKKWPSQSVDDKKARADKMEELFNTRSWTKVSESTESDVLRKGLSKLKGDIAPPPIDDKEAAMAEAALAAKENEEINGVFKGESAL